MSILNGSKTEANNVASKYKTRLRVYKFGEKGSGFIRADPQDFYKLRESCLDSGTLFEDPQFPPTEDSLSFSGDTVPKVDEWKRPHEIANNPQLFIEGHSRFDVKQGHMRDCWLLAAIANLTLHKRLFLQVVPDDQGFDNKYAGIFHFRFWQYGHWIDVVIDDKLPTYRGQLVFLHSTDKNVFWSALLEKAYAKLHGSYEALKGGRTCEAMQDFTGGVTEMYKMNPPSSSLFKIVLKSYERGSLISASLRAGPNILENKTSEGLIRKHVYNITRVCYVDSTKGKIPLLRMRNPWSSEAEWNGKWSDKSPEWQSVPEHEKQKLGLTLENDGEFWISFKDFLNNFGKLEICNLCPDFLSEEELTEGNKKCWEVSSFHGEWVRGITAGGSLDYFTEYFASNPQYIITLTDLNKDNEDGMCTLIIALMQKNRRSQCNMGIKNLDIGFYVYHLNNINKFQLAYADRVRKQLDQKFFMSCPPMARSPRSIHRREISLRFKLPPGTYCIVPSTFKPGEEGEFLLRIFSEKANSNRSSIDMEHIDALYPTSLALYVALPIVTNFSLFCSFLSHSRVFITA